MEKEYIFSGGSLYYELQRNSVSITRVSGTAGELLLPARIENCPVETISKKAFLSQKNIRRIVVPKTVQEIGDWAFAYCTQLQEVVLEGAAVRFGRAVFKECPALKRITLPVGSETEASCPELLAAAVTLLDAYYLLDPGAVGTAEWLEKWDARMLAILHTSDQDGYSKQVLCGEEDYGSTDLNAYRSANRRKKARLALLRLLYANGLTEPVRRELEEYVRAHTKGGRSQEAWEVVWKEHAEDKLVFQLFASLGGVTRDNLDDILLDIGEHHPEMKAYFLKLLGSTADAEDFFEDLYL